MSDTNELLERYRDGAEVVASAIHGVSGEEEDFIMAPGKWTIRQLMAHLADADLVGAHRFRQLIAEVNPTIVAFNQDQWATKLDYSRRDVQQSLDAIRRLRAENYALLQPLPQSAYERSGNHTERGPITLGQMLQGFAGHAESHARQMQQIRDAYQQSKGKQ